MIRAVIFDLDGVVAQTERQHIKAEQETLRRYGVEISSDELHLYTGTTAKAMFTELIKKYDLKTTFERISGEKEQIFLELLKSDLQPTSGVIPLIRRLKHNGMKLAIASSSDERIVNFVLFKLRMAQFFDAIVTSERVTHGKPDPEIFLKTAKDLEVEPCECVVIEDSTLGIEAAKSAGMRCVGYRNPDSGKQNLLRADFLVDSFAKLIIDGSGVRVLK